MGETLRSVRLSRKSVGPTSQTIRDESLDPKRRDLTSSRTIVEQHGRRLWVSRQEAKARSFTFNCR
jgi:hypothetical protein